MTATMTMPMRMLINRGDEGGDGHGDYDCGGDELKRVMVMLMMLMLHGIAVHCSAVHCIAVQCSALPVSYTHLTLPTKRIV